LKKTSNKVESMASIVVQYNKDPRDPNKKRPYAYFMESRWNAQRKGNVPKKTFLGSVNDEDEVVFSRRFSGRSHVTLSLEKVKAMTAAGEHPGQWAVAQSEQPNLIHRKPSKPTIDGRSKAPAAPANPPSTPVPPAAAQAPVIPVAVPVPSAGASVKSVGAPQIFLHLADESGLRRCLVEAFGDEADIILTLGIFLAAEGQAWMHCEDWIDSVSGLPNAAKNFDFGSRSLSGYLAELGEDLTSRETFFPAWIKAQSKLDQVLVDTTSFSTHSKNLSDAEWGKNRDGELLPQVNLQLAAAADTSMPLAYRRLPGSIPDVASVKVSLNFFKVWGLISLTSVYDRGFFSKTNLENMVREKHDFVIAVPIGNAQAKTKMKENRRALRSPKSAFKIEDDIVGGVTIDWAIDPEQAAEGANRLNGTLLRNASVQAERSQSLMKTVIEIEGKSQDEAFKTPEDAQEWLNASAPGQKRLLKPELSGTTWKLIRKPNTIAALTESFGQQVILSTQAKSPSEVACVYRNRGLIEQLFDLPKNDLRQKRLRSGNDFVVDGHLFLVFISVILTRLLANKLAANKETSTIPLSLAKPLIRRMQIHQTATGNSFSYDITKKQRLIRQAVGVPEL
jgi:hypothetical protein